MLPADGVTEKAKTLTVSPNGVVCIQRTTTATPAAGTTAPPEQQSPASSAADAPKVDGPEERWMRRRFPAVLKPGTGRVFTYAKGVVDNFESDYLLPQCIGLPGNAFDPWAYVPETDEYLHYDPERGIYAEATEAEVERAFVELLEECARDSGTRRPEAIRRLQRRYRIRPLVHALRGVSVLHANAFEHDFTHVYVRTGILDLRTLEIEPHSPARPARSVVPIDWDPSAPEPARFREFLAHMFPDPDDQTLAVRLIALALIGNRYQKVAILRGRSGSGKSTLVKLLCEIVGEDAYGQLRLEASHGRFEVERWMHKRVLSQLDASEKVLQTNTHVLKALSGQDRYQPEFKHETRHATFVPRALVVITTNADVRLRLEDDHDAWRRRLVILHTEAPPPSRVVPDLERELVREEGPGILRLVAREAKELLELGELPLSDAQQERIEAFLDLADPVRAFVRGFIEPAEGEHLYAELAFRAARRYLHGLGHRMPDQTIRTRLARAMEEIYGARRSNSLPPKAGVSTKGWRHFRIRSS